MDTLFGWMNLFVLPFWALMILLPHWRGTRTLFRSPLVLTPLPMLYLVLVLPHLREVGPILLNPNLAQIASLLGRPEGALVAWAHFLAFDLFVGRWVYLDSRERQITAWLTGPILGLTLMLGPCGLLVYLIVRTAWNPPAEHQPPLQPPWATDQP